MVSLGRGLRPRSFAGAAARRELRLQFAQVPKGPLRDVIEARWLRGLCSTSLIRRSESRSRSRWILTGGWIRASGPPGQLCTPRLDDVFWRAFVLSYWN
jgi:hypothetical protein